ncbi:DNA polymerase I [bacterium]|jgi:DNA polymerase I|nr:DNA polymerase I [bacterium]MBT4597985.1 DNA polymerase I [bacterium]MBT6753602.1 DNA polymerase I [bacterium]MBT7037717.1 DNA polymerase I [bacterium]MBT7432047.1 DNA polymerase I [bacterium]
MTKQDNKKTLVLIDSNALIHRAFHALPPLTKKDGTPTGAVYGYALTLLNVIEQLKPDYIAATFDLKGPTFRHEKYDQYKATRKKAPDELYAQIPIVKEMLRNYGIPIFEKAGFEADDVIGTLAKKGDLGVSQGLRKVIVTGDMDALQLVDDDISVFTLRKGIKDTVIYDEAAVKARYNLTPAQIIDYKSLCGDASDNIPGVKGIGAIGATKLLVEFGTLDGVYKNVEKVSAKAMKKKLEEGKEDAYLSYDLATIRTDVEFDFDLEKCSIGNLKERALASFFQEMEFYALFKKLGGNGSDEDGRQNSDFPKIIISIVEKKKDIKQLAEDAKKAKQISITGLSVENKFFDPEILGFGVSVDGKKGFFVEKNFMDELREILLDEEIEKVGYSSKFEMQLVNSIFKETFSENIFDVQIAAYLLDPSIGNELEKLIFSEFGAELENRITKKGQASLLDDTTQVQKKEVAEKAIWQLRLQKQYKEELDKISNKQKLENDASLKNIFQKLEIPVVSIIAGMENAGIKVQTQILDDISIFAQSELDALEKEIHKQAGEKFNVNSPSQLAVILFEKLEIPSKNVKRGKTGFSTAAGELDKIKNLHSIIPLIGRYRELFKVKTTYTDALPRLVENDGRIHAHFNQAVTATGRLSSSEPNLQNIPKKGDLAKMIRESFICEKGKLLISADYSQIDLRVAAHLSEDPRMIDAFKKGQDIHRATAAWVNGVSEDEVSDKQRSEAKSLNFGILYGMGLYGFMQDSGVSRERAKFFIDEYMKAFSKLKEFLERVKESTRGNGFIETELGRRRYIPAINSQNSMARNAAERTAINLPIQGLAADIMKLAMIGAQKDLLEKYNKEKVVVKMILQIHDELIFEVDEGVADEFEKDLKKSMEGVYDLKVPLIVDVSRGKNWGEL